MNNTKYPLLTCLIVLVLQGCGGGKSPALGNLNNSIDDNDTKKIFYITSKIEFKLDENVTTTYIYNNGYLSKMIKRSTDGWSDKKTYKYFENYKVMKTYDARDNVESVAVFSTLSSPDSAYLYDRRLSFDKNVKYLVFTNDTLTHHNPYHIKKFITINTSGNLYTYNSSDLLSKIENGSFNDNNGDAINQLENDTNTSYLLSTTDKPLAFTANQESRYNYNANEILTSITFEADGSTLEADVNVTLYSTGALKELTLSTGDKFVYSFSGYLTTKTTVQNGSPLTKNYTYSSDKKTITVKDANGDIAQQYTFDELK